MEINFGVPEDYLQGNAETLESLDPEEYEFPAEDKRRKSKLRSVKVGRGKSN